jgi:hypothetical protein
MVKYFFDLGIAPLSYKGLYFQYVNECDVIWGFIKNTTFNWYKQTVSKTSIILLPDAFYEGKCNFGFS